jgi:hypothetical protein
VKAFTDDFPGAADSSRGSSAMLRHLIQLQVLSPTDCVRDPLYRVKAVAVALCLPFVSGRLVFVVVSRRKTEFTRELPRLGFLFGVIAHATYSVASD